MQENIKVTVTGDQVVGKNKPRCAEGLSRVKISKIKVA